MTAAKKIKKEYSAEEPFKPKGGRPRKPIEFDPSETIRGLAFLHLTNKDIANLAGICTDTLKNRWGKELEEGRAEGRKAIRHAIYKSATKQGNIKAQVYLDQKLNGDPIENAEQLTEKISTLADELYKVARKPDGKQTS